MQPTLRVLLVEDDPVSRAVLEAAVARCGVAVDTADCLQAALSQAAFARHALWLVDAHLPDGAGIDLLVRLRSIDAGPVAIAHTASLDADIHRRLRNAGFAEVMVKPLSSDQVSAALRPWLPLPGSDPAPATAAQADPVPGQDESPIWDDAGALRALNGNRGHVAALRALFVAELPVVAERIAATVLRLDHAALRSELHRLHASCGFVGALRLASAARTLEMRYDDEGLQRFEAVVHATLASYREPQPT